MLILAIETSCDETAVAVTRKREVLAEELFSQADMHALYGGIVPEIASRNHAAHIGRLAELTIKNAGITKADLEAVAVTYAPGLIGALLVGVNFAKGLAMALDVPLIPVHHIRGHIAANYIAYPELEPPFLCVIVSGGNSLIADVRSYTDIGIVGRSRDDAAGECFDKAARVMGLGYPGGPAMDKLAQSGGDEKKFALPRPIIDDAPYDMSFSGLKTSVVNIVHNAKQYAESKGEAAEPFDEASLAASFAAAVSDIIVPRVMTAAEELGHKKIAIAGGVAANSRIRADFLKAAEQENKELFIPPLRLCGDNAAMIGCQGYYEYLAGTCAGMDLNGYATVDADQNYPPE
jgi:N6-L-threonylcarbamoyladenine synthase